MKPFDKEFTTKDDNGSLQAVVGEYEDNWYDIVPTDDGLLFSCVYEGGRHLPAVLLTWAQITKLRNNYDFYIRMERLES